MAKIPHMSETQGQMVDQSDKEVVGRSIPVKVARAPRTCGMR
jgi:hypothetical protein